MSLCTRAHALSLAVKRTDAASDCESCSRPVPESSCFLLEAEENLKALESKNPDRYSVYLFI